MRVRRNAVGRSSVDRSSVDRSSVDRSSVDIGVGDSGVVALGGDCDVSMQNDNAVSVNVDGGERDEVLVVAESGVESQVHPRDVEQASEVEIADLSENEQDEYGDPDELNEQEWVMVC